MMIRNVSDPASRQFVWAIFGIGVIVSVLLSIWSIAIDSVINNDGIEYVRAAELLSSGDWQAAFSVYKWPFYPWLMMWVGDTVGISYETAGHALNTLFFTLVVVFFVTSSDSGSLVIDTITAGGKVDAPVPQRVFWCIFEGAVAIALLIGGGLAALQSMVISTGLLFTLLLLFMCFCIFRGLQDERKIR